MQRVAWGRGVTLPVVQGNIRIRALSEKIASSLSLLHMQSASDHLVTQVTSSTKRLGPGAGSVSAPDSVLVAL